jgi:hypothetical protein
MQQVRTAINSVYFHSLEVAINIDFIPRLFQGDKRSLVCLIINNEIMVETRPSLFIHELGIQLSNLNYGTKHNVVFEIGLVTEG